MDKRNIRPLTAIVSVPCRDALCFGGGGASGRTGRFQRFRSFFFWWPSRCRRPRARPARGRRTGPPRSSASRREGLSPSDSPPRRGPGPWLPWRARTQSTAGPSGRPGRTQARRHPGPRSSRPATEAHDGRQSLCPVRSRLSSAGSRVPITRTASRSDRPERRPRGAASRSRREMGAPSGPRRRH